MLLAKIYGANAVDLFQLIIDRLMFVFGEGIVKIVLDFENRREAQKEEGRGGGKSCFAKVQE